MAIIGILLATLINFFFLKSGLISLIISYVIVVLFCVVTAYDVQMLKNLSAQAMDENTATKLAVLEL